MKTHNEEFQAIKIQLSMDGYKEKDVTITSGKAMVFGILYALPFVLILGLIYRFSLIERAHLTETGGIMFYITFIIIIAVSVAIHELLHGVGWSISSGRGWGIIRFNIGAMMPSCACEGIMGKKQYLLGVLMPFMVLGAGSIIFLFVYPGTISILTMAVNFIAAGADLIIAFNVFKEEQTVLIADHPTEAGYIVFYK